MQASESAEVTIRIDDSAIDGNSLLALVADPDCGAQLLFLGTTRHRTGTELTTELFYEAYRPMADNQLRTIALQAAERWGLRKVAIQHRLGVVTVGQASVAVAVSSPHRQAVMEAIAWIMNELKRDVPIWKREQRPDGETEWVHR